MATYGQTIQDSPDWIEVHCSECGFTAGLTRKDAEELEFANMHDCDQPSAMNSDSAVYRINALDDSGILLERAYIWSDEEIAAETARDYFIARPNIAVLTDRVTCTNLKTGLGVAMPDSPIDEFIDSIDDFDRLYAGLIPEPAEWQNPE